LINIYKCKIIMSNMSIDNIKKNIKKLIMGITSQTIKIDKIIFCLLIIILKKYIL